MRPVPIALSVLGVVVVGFAYVKLTAAKPVGKTTYTIASVSKGSVKKTVSATGTLQAWTTVDVKSKAGGRIDLLAVDVGSKVKSGQIIAKIDPTDSLLTYNQAKASTDSAEAKETQSGETYRLTITQADIAVQQARATLASAKAALVQATARRVSVQTENSAQPTLTDAAINQAKAVYESAVQDRTKLTSTQTQDRASAQATYDQAVANDKYAQANLVRQKALLTKGFVSQSTVDSAAANAGVTRATVNSAKSKLDTISAQQIAEKESSDATVRQALAAYNTSKANRYLVKTKQSALEEYKGAEAQAIAAVSAAEAELRDAVAAKANGSIKKLDITSSAASVASAKAQLANAKTTLDQTVVTAPSDGVVLTKSVEQGTIITSGLSLNSTGTSIVTLGDISRMYVDVAVDETDIASIRIGEKVDITFDAYPDRQFSGKVTKINPQGVVESNVTTIHVRVEVDNKAKGFSDLKPQMNATCEFIEGEANDVLTIPSEAVTVHGEEATVEVAVGGKPVVSDGKTPSDPNTLTDVKSEQRKVVVGLIGTDITEIKSGLSEGDRVIVSKNEPAVDDSAPKSAFASGPGGPPSGGKK